VVAQKATVDHKECGKVRLFTAESVEAFNQLDNWTVELARFPVDRLDSPDICDEICPVVSDVDNTPILDCGSPQEEDVQPGVASDESPASEDEDSSSESAASDFTIIFAKNKQAEVTTNK
jgi:hypothetical protein